MSNRRERLQIYVKAFAALLLVFLSVAAICASIRGPQAVGHQAAMAEILAIHRADRLAHFNRDVSSLLRNGSAELIEVRDSNIKHMSRAALEDRFQQYFASAKFLAWDDMQEPIVHVSADGKMAWMIVKVHVRYEDIQHNNRIEDNVLAWMSVYEEIDGRWVMQAVATTSPAKS